MTKTLKKKIVMMTLELAMILPLATPVTAQAATRTNQDWR